MWKEQYCTAMPIVLCDLKVTTFIVLPQGVRPAVPSVESNIYKVAGNCYEETRYEKSSLQRCRTDSVRIRTSKSNTDLR